MRAVAIGILNSYILAFSKQEIVAKKFILTV
jgi:hypothetical protein